MPDYSTITIEEIDAKIRHLLAERKQLLAKKKKHSTSITDLAKESRNYISQFARIDQQFILRIIYDLYCKLRVHGSAHLSLDDIVDLFSRIGLLLLAGENLYQAQIVNLAKQQGLLHRNGNGHEP